MVLLVQAPPGQMWFCSQCTALFPYLTLPVCGVGYSMHHSPLQHFCPLGFQNTVSSVLCPHHMIPGCYLPRPGFGKPQSVGQTQLATCFCNKALLEHSHGHSFTYCVTFHAAGAAWSGGSRHQMARKAENTSLWPCMGKACQPLA